MNNLNAKQMKSLIDAKLSHHYGLKPEDADNDHIYKAIVLVVRDILFEARKEFADKYDKNNGKRVYYLCMEFLMGRSLRNNLYNLNLEKVVSQCLAEYDTTLEKIYDQEPDAGLGNGGLGRLAACFLDGLANDGYCGMGYSLRYEFGIFNQKIIDGWQTELPDNWLPGGGAWLTPVEDQAIEVHFDGEVREYWENEYHHISHVNYNTVLAVPYDMYVSGYDSEGVSKLRLWSAKSLSFDMSAFNSGDYTTALGASNIAHSLTKVLYPNDNHLEGKALRLRQQYFMCAASIGDIVMRHMNIYGTLENLPDKVAIHINDTHPTLAIPELMRILLDDCGYDWNKSWDIVCRTFAYTNHTVMAEALEKWDKNLIEKILPRIYSIICEINRRYCEKLSETLPYEKVEAMSIFRNNQIRMATLCVAASHSVNGVSKLHSEIIKDSVFHDEYELTPNKFTNVTNGIAYRRWLLQSNPNLTGLISECIGDGFKKDGRQLAKLRSFLDDRDVLTRLSEIKHKNKESFAKYVYNTTGTKLNPDSIFDVQVKRLHEYKRQQLNALHIISQFNYLRNNPDADFQPKTYIFASKAAPGYYMAKQIIKLIWCIGEELKKDPKLNEKLAVIFLEDYRVTLSELLMPAAEISEQISLAGTEASGTGNMKLMLNGAVTMGTYDGANVEIHEQVGDDNIYIFGMYTPEVGVMRSNGYSPDGYYDRNDTIRGAIDAMYRGFNGATFDEVANAVRYVDQYMCLADFESYRSAQERASNDYRDTAKWNRMSLANIAGAGVFSADRAVSDYARDIWKLN
jgi:starch phosphorylase